jgi:hypothetical protein
VKRLRGNYKKMLLVKLQDLSKKLGLPLKNLAIFLAFLGFILIPIIVANIFHINLNRLILTIDLVLLAILSLIAWSMAGLAVFRSLFVVGAGLSLLIFIADSYCKVSLPLQTGNQALDSIIRFGLLYLVLQFISVLYKELFGDKDAKSEMRQKGAIKVIKEVGRGIYYWVFLVLYAMFIGVFLDQFYNVVKPIILNLCIYK